jgi:hypothetical protein
VRLASRDAAKLIHQDHGERDVCPAATAETNEVLAFADSRLPRCAR